MCTLKQYKREKKKIQYKGEFYSKWGDDIFLKTNYRRKGERFNNFKNKVMVQEEHHSTFQIRIASTEISVFKKEIVGVGKGV